ncbi:hypothetical protein [Sphingobacterium sp. BN32]|uniref:hypothetical protein n=1 Tax=Sphingobacterium sp. BN32 TaxID=3058432 RepID=UPI00265D0BBF|nr:hypothetical protein [Sphingobacterium sp. BN32]WKK58554.1 hypothetical protein QYC40_18185 [Sphingobacterium sp. BN32]
MFKQNEIEKLEGRIKKTLSIIEIEHFSLNEGGDVDDFEEENPGFTQYWIKHRLKDLYILIQTYFEVRQLPQLLIQFKNELDCQFKKDIFEEVQTHPDAPSELKIALLFRRFLEAFSFFDYNISEIDNQKKLISILKNTGHIVKNTNCSLDSEAEIYKKVKWALGLYFHSCRLLNKASFIQQFKTYHPDILIPELNSAIEYKFLKSEDDNIDNFLDQLKIDSVNYVNDLRYDTFYAVFFIKDISIATPESIELAWKNKDFPNNWKLVITGHHISETTKNE